MTLDIRIYFFGYFADVEYNRMTKQQKEEYGSKITITYEDKTPIEKKIVCDLLIQTRTEAPNLLAVEMKKEGNKDSVNTDKERLCEMVSKGNDFVHNTLIGAFITYSPDEVTIEFFEADADGKGSLTDTSKFDYDKNEKALIQSR